jgi:hypothetical protein
MATVSGQYVVESIPSELSLFDLPPDVYLLKQGFQEHIHGYNVFTGWQFASVLVLDPQFHIHLTLHQV